MKQFLCQRAMDLRQGGIRAFFDKAAAYPGAINLGIGEPDSITPQPIINAAYEAMRAGLTHYTANAGSLEARGAVAQYLEGFGYRADPMSEIIVTNGGMGAVSMALFCAISLGDEVLIQDPQWLNYEAQVRFMGGVSVRIPGYESNGFLLEPEDVERRITARTKVLMLNSPNNPTGAVLDAERLRAIAAIAIKHDLLVLSDEVYCELIYDGAVHHMIACLDGMRERTISINSLSKTFAMTGWRIGFAAGPAYFIKKMVYLQENLAACASSIGQSAGAYALVNRCGIEQMRSMYQRRRDLLVDGLNSLNGVSCLLPKGAFYAFANIKESGFSSVAMAELLLEKAGVVTVPGSAFGDHGEGYLRISYASSEEKLTEALARMGHCLGYKGEPKTMCAE